MSNEAPHSSAVFDRHLPVSEYPALNKEDVRLSEDGLSPARRQQAWKKLDDYLRAYRSTMIGYQMDANIQCSGVLKNYLDLHLNNLGDPFGGGRYPMNTKVMECAILDYFAKLWNIALPDAGEVEDEDEAYWGYVVSMGCTEANLYALYNARDYLAGKPLLHDYNDAKTASSGRGVCQECDNAATTSPNAFTPIVFFSEDAHYCQDKAIQLLQISTFHEVGSGNFPCPLSYPDDYPDTYGEVNLDENGWPRSVPVGADGSMYLPSLVKLVSAFVSRGYPPMVLFTTGATFKGNYENPQPAINILVPILKQHNLYERRVHYSSTDPSKFDVRRGFWFHVDGALGAGHLPFLEMALNEGAVEKKLFPNGFPVFDFRIPEVMSIAMSFHKWFGCPFPSGIFMTRKKNQLMPPSNPQYIGCGDTTFAGSRNAHSVLVLWDIVSKASYSELTERAVRGENMVMFTLKKLQVLEKEIGEDLWLSRSPGSLFLCFKRPRQDIARKFSLACRSSLVKTKQGSTERRFYAHVCLMSHVTEEMIESFIKDLKEPGAFPKQETSGR